MKRNHTTHRIGKTGASPYVKRDKKPYIYPEWVTNRSKAIPEHITKELWEARK